MPGTVFGMAESELRVVYQGRCTVGGGRHTISCFASGSGYLVRVARTSYWVERPGGLLRVLAEPTGRVTGEPFALRAPAEIVSLAVRGIYCLHASAVATPLGVLAFVGTSGKGKSTLAAHLSSHAGPRSAPQISDDLLPVALKNSPPVVLRDAFPGSHHVAAAERLPLRAIYVLKKWSRKEVEAKRLSQREAFLAIARHSVATRLLDAPLRRAHFDGCVNTSHAIPVYELSYERRLSALDEIRELIDA